MKINKINKHLHGRRCLDPWVCYHKDTICNTKVNNSSKSSFNHLLKYRELKDVHHMSNYKFRNDINDIRISKYKSKLFNQFTIFNTSIDGISVYFEDMSFYKNDNYSYTNNSK